MEFRMRIISFRRFLSHRRHSVVAPRRSVVLSILSALFALVSDLYSGVPVLQACRRSIVVFARPAGVPAAPQPLPDQQRRRRLIGVIVEKPETARTPSSGSGEGAVYRGVQREGMISWFLVAPDAKDLPHDRAGAVVAPVFRGCVAAVGSGDHPRRWKPRRLSARRCSPMSPPSMHCAMTTAKALHPRR